MVDMTTAPGRDTGQQLERRRADLVSSREEAAAGRVALSELEGHSDALRGTRDDTKRRLDEAEQLAERLRRELKKNSKDRDQLERRIRDARKALAELDRRAGTREQKYDRAVLADMVEREKARDLALTPPSAGTRTTEQDKPAQTATVVDRKADGTTVTRRTRAGQPTVPAKPAAAATTATPAKPAAAPTTATPAPTAAAKVGTARTGAGSAG